MLGVALARRRPASGGGRGREAPSRRDRSEAEPESTRPRVAGGRPNPQLRENAPGNSGARSRSRWKSSRISGKYRSKLGQLLVSNSRKTSATTVRPGRITAWMHVTQKEWSGV